MGVIKERAQSADGGVKGVASRSGSRRYESQRLLACRIPALLRFPSDGAIRQQSTLGTAPARLQYPQGGS